MQGVANTMSKRASFVEKEVHVKKERKKERRRKYARSCKHNVEESKVCRERKKEENKKTIENPNLHTHLHIMQRQSA